MLVDTIYVGLRWLLKNQETLPLFFKCYKQVSPRHQDRASSGVLYWIVWISAGFNQTCNYYCDCRCLLNQYLALCVFEHCLGYRDFDHNEPDQEGMQLHPKAVAPTVILMTLADRCCDILLLLKCRCWHDCVHSRYDINVIKTWQDMT